MRRRALLISVLVLLQLVSFHSAPTAAFTPEAISQISNLAQDAISSGSFLDLSQYGLSNWGISSKLYAWLQQALVDVFNMDEGTLTSLATALFSGSGSNLASAGVGAATGGLAGALTGGAAGAWREATNVMGPGGPPQPPPLPPLPAKHPLAPWATEHDKALHVLADAWTSALVKAQFNPGLQTMLKITGLDEMQEALIKWVCILYPWKGPVADAIIPDAISALRDAYCVKALPAEAVAKLMPPKPSLLGPLGPPVIPGPGILG